MLTAELDDPTGYGRICAPSPARSAGSSKRRTRPRPSARIREVNTGLMALPTARLGGWLARIRQRQCAARVLPHRRREARARGRRRACRPCASREPWEMLGVNSRAQLAQLERIYQRERADELLESGVALADPARLDVRGELDLRARRAHRRELRVRRPSRARRRRGDRRELRAAERRRSAPAPASSRSATSRTRRSASAAGSGPMRASARARGSAKTCTSAISSR